MVAFHTEEAMREAGSDVSRADDNSTCHVQTTLAHEEQMPPPTLQKQSKIFREDHLADQIRSCRDPYIERTELTGDLQRYTMTEKIDQTQLSEADMEFSDDFDENQNSA